MSVSTKPVSTPESSHPQTLLEQAKRDGVVFPPSDRDSQEPPLESYLHLQQMLLLLKCLDWLWKARTDYFAAGNLTIFYSQPQRKSEDFRGPDFFVVLNTEKRPRKSWTVWAENGQYPHVIIELLSDSTAKTDRNLKKQIYQDTFRTPDYFWFDPNTLEFQGFHLVEGLYQALPPNAQGHLWSQQLGLFLGVDGQNLRFFTPEGDRVPTPEESAEIERQRAEAERERADTERERAEAERQRNQVLAAKLGVDPADL